MLHARTLSIFPGDFMRISTRQLLRNPLSIWAITGSSTILTGGFHFIPSSWSVGNQCSTFSSAMKSENQTDIPDISTWKWIGLFVRRTE